MKKFRAGNYIVVVPRLPERRGVALDSQKIGIIPGETFLHIDKFEAVDGRTRGQLENKNTWVTIQKNDDEPNALYCPEAHYKQYKKFGEDNDSFLKNLIKYLKRLQNRRDETSGPENNKLVQSSNPTLQTDYSIYYIIFGGLLTLIAFYVYFVSDIFQGSIGDVEAVIANVVVITSPEFEPKNSALVILYSKMQLSIVSLISIFGLALLLIILQFIWQYLTAESESMAQSEINSEQEVTAEPKVIAVAQAIVESEEELDSVEAPKTPVQSEEEEKSLVEFDEVVLGYLPPDNDLHICYSWEEALQYIETDMNATGITSDGHFYWVKHTYNKSRIVPEITWKTWMIKKEVFMKEAESEEELDSVEAPKTPVQSEEEEQSLVEFDKVVLGYLPSGNDLHICNSWEEALQYIKTDMNATGIVSDGYFYWVKHTYNKSRIVPEITWKTWMVKAQEFIMEEVESEEAEDALVIVERKMTELHSTTGGDFVVWKSIPLQYNGKISFIANWKWKDQGWGNQKGKIKFCIKRTDDNFIYDHVCAEICSHDWTTSNYERLDCPEIHHGDLFEIYTQVGTGGGHELHITNFTLVIKRV